MLNDTKSGETLAIIEMQPATTVEQCGRLLLAQPAG